VGRPLATGIWKEGTKESEDSLWSSIFQTRCLGPGLPSIQSGPAQMQIWFSHSYLNSSIPRSKDNCLQPGLRSSCIWLLPSLQGSFLAPHPIHTACLTVPQIRWSLLPQGQEDLCPHHSPLPQVQAQVTPTHSTGVSPNPLPQGSLLEAQSVFCSSVCTWCCAPHLPGTLSQLGVIFSGAVTLALAAAFCWKQVIFAPPFLAHSKSSMYVI
jgi:hypothetical protein